jgi:alpha-beta hydrolase superfamily lysophospholipase
MAEHGARYESFASSLVDAGFVIYAHDHRGHGKTVGSEAELGFFANQGGWQRVVDDLHEHVQADKAAHPECPVVLFGHSMGSLLGQEYLIQYGDGLAGAILCGSSGKPPLLAQLGRVVARLERVRQGPRGRSLVIHGLAFGPFNKPFEPGPTDFEWLSRDRAQVDAYVADDRCGFLCTNQLWIDLLDGIQQMSDPERQSRIPSDLPVFIVAGSEDPVGDRTASLHQLVAAYQAAGLTRVDSRFYEGARHEILNETNRDQVERDLVQWVESVVPVPGS